MFLEINDISTGILVTEPLNVFSINYVYVREEDNKKKLIYVLNNGIRKIEEFDTQQDLEERLTDIANASMGGLVQKDSFAEFPAKGSKGSLYLAKDTGQEWYWDQNTETYIKAGIAGRTGVYLYSGNLPTTSGQSATINKSDLTTLVHGTVEYMDGSEVLGDNSTLALIISSTSNQVTVKTIPDRVIDSFQQVDTAADLGTGLDNILKYVRADNMFRVWDSENQEYIIPTIEASLKPFPSEFPTTGTTQNFLTTLAGLDLPEGSEYLGEVTFSDLPSPIGNAEIVVDVYDGVIWLTLRSSNVSPYMWTCNSHSYRGWEPVVKPATDMIGTLSNLDTTEKSNIVGAINEVNSGTLGSNNIEYVDISINFSDSVSNIINSLNNNATLKQKYGMNKIFILRNTYGTASQNCIAGTMITRYEKPFSSYRTIQSLYLTMTSDPIIAYRIINANGTIGVADFTTSYTVLKTADLSSVSPPSTSRASFVKDRDLVKFYGTKDITSLNTTTKTSLVDAINEVNTNAVKTSGNQTISGVKTFNSLPQSSVTPSNANDLVNKSYVDTGLSSRIEQIGVMPQASIDYDSKTVQYIGPTTNNYRQGYFYKCIEGAGEVYSWEQVNVQAPATVRTIPFAYSVNEGEVVQYIGVTDQNYTNGYFYKCVSDGQNPAHYSWIRIDVQPAPDMSNYYTKGETDEMIDGIEDLIGDVNTILATLTTLPSMNTIEDRLENVVDINTCTVVFNTDGGSAVPSQTVDSGNTIEEPTAPTKSGYTFDAWYTEDTFENEYDFTDPVTTSFTLYAKWIQQV